MDRTHRVARLMRLAADSVRRVAGIVGRAVDTALPTEVTTRLAADIALPVEPIALRAAATAAAEIQVEDSTAVAMAEDIPVAVAGTPVAGTAAVGATKRAGGTKRHVKLTRNRMARVADGMCMADAVQ